MTDTHKVTAEDVRHVADLAHLELTPDEESSMRRDLNAILDHIAQLNEVDTSQVPPMAQVSEVLQSAAAASANVLRPDTPAPSLDRATVLRCAPETDGAFFKVPKVIER